MLGVLTHPGLAYDWFTTTLLRWSGDGLVIYDRWVIGSGGVSDYKGGGGEVLLDFYYLCYLIAFIGVITLFTRYRKQGWLKVKPHVPYDALLMTMIGVLVGAKLAYIFIYNPDFYFGPPPYGPVDTGDQLRRIFLNWSGMSSHGAAFGVMFMALVWWLKGRPQIPIAQMGDIGGIAAAFGAAWIRLANFMNGELYGRVASEGLPWAMRFPVRSGKGNAVVQRQGELYEVMRAPADPNQTEAWLASLHEANPGGVIEYGGYVHYHNAEAYLQSYELAVRTPAGVEYMATPPVPDLPPGVTHIDLSIYNLVTTPRHPSQLYQLLLEGVLVFLLLIFLRKRVKRAGMIAAAFWIAYPVARFIGEFWRQPDVQFQQAGNELGTVFLGLSMGQMLSLLMAAFGVCLLVYFMFKGRVIADMQMWPPDEKDKPKAPGGPISVPFERGMGGSTGAGEIAGLGDVRAVLAEKEKQWAAEHEAEQAAQQTDEHTEEPSDDPDSNEPGEPERRD